MKQKWTGLLVGLLILMGSVSLVFGGQVSGKPNWVKGNENAIVFSDTLSHSITSTNNGSIEKSGNLMFAESDPEEMKPEEGNETDKEPVKKKNKKKKKKSPKKKKKKSKK